MGDYGWLDVYCLLCGVWCLLLFIGCRWSIFVVCVLYCFLFEVFCLRFVVCYSLLRVACA